MGCAEETGKHAPILVHTLHPCMREVEHNHVEGCCVKEALETRCIYTVAHTAAALPYELNIGATGCIFALQDVLAVQGCGLDSVACRHSTHYCV
jgi:hypothetical protein